MGKTVPNCQNCGGERWVCEDHRDVPWIEPRHWTDTEGWCGGAGAPCPVCNPCDESNAPAMPPDTIVTWSA